MLELEFPSGASSQAPITDALFLNSKGVSGLTRAIF